MKRRKTLKKLIAREMKVKSQSTADMTFDKTKPISDDVDSLIGNEALEVSKEDPIEANRDKIVRVVENYTKMIKLLRRQLNDAWIPLMKGEVNSEVFIDDPSKMTEKEWEEKIKECDRLLNQISLIVRR